MTIEDTAFLSHDSSGGRLDQAQTRPVEWPWGAMSASGGTTTSTPARKTDVGPQPKSGRTELLLGVMGWTPPDGIYVPE